MQYQLYEGMPPENVIEQIMNLYETIFQTSSKNIRNKMQKVDRLLVLVALDNGKVVGFKVGYEQGANEFYSWIGGVDSAYRRQGIGSTLMAMQHDWLKQHDYSVVTTTTKNKWRNMLILNLSMDLILSARIRTKRGNRKLS
jgi:ribosomal protein S18 acetylase RimI-like enzyme